MLCESARVGIDLVIQDLCHEEKPRERCLRLGPQSLSFKECLALLIGTGPKGVGCLGVATNLLKNHNGEVLTDDDFFRIYEDNLKVRLEAEYGLGPSGQSRILAAFEIAKRYCLYRQGGRKEPLVVTNLKKTLRSKLNKEFRYASTERFGLVAYLTDGCLSEFIELAHGDETSVVVSGKKLFQTLMYMKADSFWLFHNHPNGVLVPSHKDKELTRNLSVMAKIIGIPMNGHWIVCGEREIEC